jgi:tripartite-type tricarboxylate transporter receptor subunit TctC
MGGASRSTLVPDTPTLTETWPGFEVVTWYSIVAPAKTPRALVMKLNGEIAKALAGSDTIARLTAAGHIPAPSTPEAMLDYTRSEIAKFDKLIKAAGMRLDG